MRAIVGVPRQAGRASGADSYATRSYRHTQTTEQPVEKLTIVGDQIIIAGFGQRGLGQRFNDVVKCAFEENLFKRHHIEVGRELCRRGIADFESTKAPADEYGALVGFTVNNLPYLCVFPSDDFQPEFRDANMWYCSVGSGQAITDPFLAFMREIFWTGGPPTVQDGTFTVTWTLDHAVAVNPGGINAPVRIAVLERFSGGLVARMLDDNDLKEHRQNIDQAKDRLRTYAATQQPGAADTPDIPKPKS